MLRRSSLRRRGGANRCMPKSGSSEPEGQPAQRPLRISACRKAEAEARRPTRPAESPKRCVPKSGSREPEGQPAVGKLRNGRRKNQLAQQPLRSGACRKAEAVNPKANHRAESPKQKAEESTRRGQPRSRRRKNELAQQPLRIDACRKAEAMSPKANSPSGNSETEGGRTNPPRAISEALHAEKRKQ